MRMEGKIAIVTGGASGIGEATTRLLHAEGAKVIVAELDNTRAEALAAELGDAVVPLRMNVCEVDQWTALVAFAVRRFGRIDVLVNNAGSTFGAMPVADETVEGHRAILDVNLSGVWAGMRTVLPQMRAQRSGSIVNISSIDGLVGVAHMTTYTATKFAVTGMTKSVALEAGRDGVRVNSVHPGFIETPLVAKVPPEKRVRLNDAMSRQPIARMGRPEEIAQAVLFFASDASSFCTGAELVVDGGHLAGPYRMLDD